MKRWMLLTTYWAVFSGASSPRVAQPLTHLKELARGYAPPWPLTPPEAREPLPRRYDFRSARARLFGVHMGNRVGLVGPEGLPEDGPELLTTFGGRALVPLFRSGEARSEFERAATLTRNARERGVLLARARACAGPPAD